MRHLVLSLLVVLCAGCAGVGVTPGEGGGSDSAAAATACLGNTALPPVLAGRLRPVDDPALLAHALGEPMAGGLCQGQVYQVREDARVRVYRAWNSTNPGSELGQWWAAQEPAGKVAQYRRDYEICYQWSPLDRLTHCMLAAGARVVVGTGQSARCSEFLAYPVSAAQQIFIEDAGAVVTDCETFDAEFSWRPVAR